ncbi:ABC transporter permease [Bacillus salitolerans]|uniref:ABC transporter permease n=1 Tax=Bacillus salitolerans TaxID=1437434 RepID=A0ABW4LP16_9BACI
MLQGLLAAELLKIKRKWVWFLIFLGPFGVVALQAVNFGVRYDYLTSQYIDDLWGGLIVNIQSFVPFVLIIGMSIITSIMANVDHEMRSWKHLLALPIHKYSLLLAKFIISLLLLFIASLLLLIGVIILGIILKFDIYALPLVDMIKMALYPYFAALPILALQLWVAVIYSHQGVAITLGTLGAVFSSYAFKLPDWVIWKWPSLLNSWDIPIYNVYLGFSTALVVLLVSIFHFIKKDVEE